MDSNQFRARAWADQHYPTPSPLPRKSLMRSTLGVVGAGAAALVAVGAAYYSFPTLRKIASRIWNGDVEGEFQEELWAVINNNVRAARILVQSLQEKTDLLEKQTQRKEAQAQAQAQAQARAQAQAEQAEAAAELEAPTAESDARGADSDAPASAGSSGTEPPPAVVSKGHDGYYFFDSKGNRLKNKWDSFDIDAALEEIDGGAESGAPKKPPVHPSTLLKEIHQCELDLECVLTQLDQVRGEADVRAKRKKLVGELNRHLEAVDKLRAAVNRCITKA